MSKIEEDKNSIEFFRKNYDYGESPYFGTPGAEEKSMGDFLKKKKKKKIKRSFADIIIEIEKLSFVYLQNIKNSGS